MTDSATACNDRHPSDAVERLYFLDWVRIVAFFLLILYHVGMYYVSWDWHVKSPHAGHTIEPLMLLLSPWRLGLLFMISGVASAFMLKKSTPDSFIKARSSRLLIPVLFGMFVIVPPQSYLEVVEKVAYAGSYIDFMNLYVRAYHGFCRDNGCLILPTWNHLWFVVYLWCYTALLWCLIRVPALRFSALAGKFSQWLTGWRIIVVPAVLLAFLRAALADSFPATHALVGDWYNHAHYVTLFLLGVALAQNGRFWDAATKLRWLCFVMAFACWICTVTCLNLYRDPPQAMRLAMAGVWTLFAWSAILGICGFARMHLNRDSPTRRYLTEAIFPVYIFHQTIIVMLAYYLQPAKLAVGIEAPVLIFAALAGSFWLFEIVRRMPWMRPLFGLTPGAGANVFMRVIKNGG